MDDDVVHCQKSTLATASRRRYGARVPDALLTVLDVVEAHPWLLAIIPALLIWFQLAVVRKRDARVRRSLDMDRAAKRMVRDAHEGLDAEARRRSPGDQRPGR